MGSKIRVTIWNEFVHERGNDKMGEWIRGIYPEGIHGCLAKALAADDLEIRTATLDMPEQGLPAEVLDNTDVLLWWGHCAHAQVDDALVDRIQERVLHGMGLIVLHSGHMSKIFRRMMGTSCRLHWREAGERERVWTVDPFHPIAPGVPESFAIPHTEMYGERFDIPQDGHIVFLSWYEGGNVFRSGVAFQRDAGHIINDLGADVRIGAIHCQTRTGRGAGDFGSDSLMSLKASLIAVFSRYHFNPLLSLFTGLTGFTANVLVGIFDTLAMVGFRGSLATDDGADLADFLFVNALYDDGVGVRNLKSDAGRLCNAISRLRLTVDQRMAKEQLKVLALLNGLVTDAHNLHALLEAFRNTDHHVVEQCAGQSVQTLGLLFVIRTGDKHFVALHLDGENRRKLFCKCAEFTFCGHNIALVHRDGHAGGNDNGHSSDS